MKRIADTFGRLVVLLFMASMAIASVAHAFGGDAPLAATCGGLALFAYFAARIDLLESLSGFGVKAKMRQLHETIDQASDVLEKLKRLAALSSTALLENHARAGRMGGANFRDRWDAAVRVRQLLGELQLEPSQIHAALEPWARWQVLDVAFGVMQRTQSLLRREITAAGQGKEREEAREIARGAEEFIRNELVNPYFTPATDYPARLRRIAKAAPLISDGDRARLVALVEEVAPVIESILVQHAVPDPDRWIDDMQRIAKYHTHGDPLDWRSASLEET